MLPRWTHEVQKEFPDLPKPTPKRSKHGKVKPLNNIKIKQIKKAKTHMFIVFESPRPPGAA